MRRHAVTALLVTLLVGALAGCSLGGGKPGTRGWSERGIASWYGPGFNGRKTANGETYDMDAMTAAHKELPFGTVVRVKNLDNGREISVRINDRGPFVRGRIIDLSRAAARKIDMLGPGTARVALSADLARTAAGPAIYSVQAGAFRDRARAQELAAELRRNFDVAVQRAGAWHRVRVGGRRSQDAARKLAAELRRRGYDAAVVSAD